MTPIRAIGKYLDQPMLTAKINRKLPVVFAAAGGTVLYNEVKNSSDGEKFKNGLKTAIILATTAVSAIYAPKIASVVSGRKPAKTFEQIIESNTEIINDFIQKNKLTKEASDILEKAKTDKLSLKEIDKLFGIKELKPLADKIVPPPDNISAKDIFKEIGWLSVFGAVPVIGGVAGGVLADSLVEPEWKERIPNKVNEGLYQYLANIFMCNVGAGAALGILEKMNIKSKAARCAGMVAGIITTGIVGGSLIANYIGNKILNPLLKQKQVEKRTPELLDISLHTDDIATVSLLSGLKWIEPSLPLLYSISGYRAGIGYRNGSRNDSNEHKAHFLRQKC